MESNDNKVDKFFKHCHLLQHCRDIGCNNFSELAGQKATTDSTKVIKSNERDAPYSTAPSDPDLINTEENKENVADQSSGGEKQNFSPRQMKLLKRLRDSNVRGNRDPAPNVQIENIFNGS